jgi:hypothetical protein
MPVESLPVRFSRNNLDRLLGYDIHTKHFSKKPYIPRKMHFT